MQGVKVKLVPNIDIDHQKLNFEDLGITYSEWTKLDDLDRRLLLLDNIVENIYSYIESMIEY